METDEFVSSTSEGYLLDHTTISTAYLKMRNLCVTIRSEIMADIKIHSQHTIHGQHIFPRYLGTKTLFCQLTIQLNNASQFSHIMLLSWLCIYTSLTKKANVEHDIFVNFPFSTVGDAVFLLLNLKFFKVSLGSIIPIFLYFVWLQFFILIT